MNSSPPDPKQEDEDYRPPPYEMSVWAVLGTAIVLVLGLFSVRCAQNPTSSRTYPSHTLPADPQPVLMLSEPSEDYWPCSDCHEDEPTNRTVRKLEDEHEDIVLAPETHGRFWCLDCHDADDRDQLHLADDTPIKFDDSWKLCTQCHGKKLAEWKAGVHGKRTGYWRGEKKFRTCVLCHDPHSPHFKPLEPLPPPLRPEAIRLADSVQEVPREAR